MRKLIGITLFFVLPLMGLGRVCADDQAKDIIAKAIKAAGGEDSLAKHNIVTFKETGIYYGMGDGIPYSGKYAIQRPDKFRMEIEGVFTLVSNGDKGWMSNMGQTNEMNKEQLAEQKNSHHASNVATLLPLKDKEYSLTTLGESKLGDKAAVGVRVSRKGYRDVELFFDKNSNLLLKSKWQAKAEELGGQEVTQEAFYQNHKDVDGAKIPMKIAIMRDGKKYVEADVSDYKVEAKLDDALFGKP